MPRQSIGQDGVIRYRTRLLTYDAARRFMACLKANGRFADVDFDIVDQAKGEKCCFVTFRPASEDRQYDMAGREQDKRAGRAEQEGDWYLWALDVDGRTPFYYCASLSGETYEVTSGTCSCPDFTFRCKKAGHLGIVCKHVHALTRAVASGELISLAAAYDTAEWRAAHPLPTPARPFVSRELSRVSVADPRDWPD